jgi:hypothetical protein
MSGHMSEWSGPRDRARSSPSGKCRAALHVQRLAVTAWPLVCIPQSKGVAIVAEIYRTMQETNIDFTETYDAGTMDIGNWVLTTDMLRPRIIEPTGGHPGGYLYSEVSTAIPTWATVSRRYEPGIDDESKRDSIFVGDYYTNGIDYISVDLRVLQAGSWTSNRTVTLLLRSWDATNNTVAFEATYSLPDIPNVPVAWNGYHFHVNARSATVPRGWSFHRGDGSPGTDSDWAIFMHQIDLVGFGYWKPDFAYPSLGLWKLGIDNIHVGSLP